MPRDQGSGLMRHLRSLRPLAVAGAIGLGLTLLVGVWPVIRFAYLAPSLHVAIETASGLAALLAAYLVYGRFRHSGRLTELLLVAGFLLFGFTNLALFAVPTALLGERPDAVVLWLGLLTRLAGSLAFATAAVAPPVHLGDPGAAGRGALAASLSVLAILAGSVALFGGNLPVGTHPAGAIEPLRFVGPPAVLILQFAGAVLFTATTVGFARRAVRTGDDLLAWLATGSILAAFAQINYGLFPSLYSNWVYSGDLLRLGFYLVVLFASAREIHRYWQRLAEAEVAEERRRLARELHDGVAQELAFIARRTRLATDDMDGGTLGQIAAAADRARSEARRAIAALSATGEEPFEVALEQAVEHVAARAGVRVRYEIAAGVAPAPVAREHLIRIACEAVSNAVRHSDATSITVELYRDDATRLRVVDNGVGFDAGLNGHGGYGLMIMRERAQRLGTELHLSSRPGAGTEVEVMLP